MRLTDLASSGSSSKTSTVLKSCSMSASCPASRSLTARSSCSSLLFSAPSARDAHLRRMNARTTSTLIVTARGEFRTFAAITTPCSVRTNGNLRLPPRPFFDVAICDIKDSTSPLLRTNAKSSGNLSRFRRICSFRRLVETPKRAARSASKMTCRFRTRKIGGRIAGDIITSHTIDGLDLFHAPHPNVAISRRALLELSTNSSRDEFVDNFHLIACA